MNTRPFPAISDPAWTVLLLAPLGEPVTEATAAGIVGPLLAPGALSLLDAAHLIDDEGLSPLGNTLRRHHQNKEPSTI